MYSSAYISFSFLKLTFCRNTYILFRNNAFKAVLHGSAIIQHVPIIIWPQCLFRFVIVYLT